MPDATLTSPDLAVGEQVQMEVVAGDGVRFINVIGGAGAGGAGTVTDVTGTGPIVVAPGAPNAATYNVSLVGAANAANDLIFPTIAAMAAFNVVAPSVLRTDQRALVQSNHSTWALQTSALAPDGITVVNATGAAAQWQRVGLSADLATVLAQTHWSFDSTAGNDENDGLTDGTALKTQAELIRRAGVGPYINQATTFHYVNAPAGTDPYYIKPVLGPSGSITITGALTQVATATIGAVVPNTAGTGFFTLTFAGLVGTPPAAGMYVHDTTAGAFFFLSEDTGGGVWRITNPHGNPLAQPQPYVTPAPGDALVFSTQVAIPAIEIDCEGLGASGVTLVQVGFNAADVIITIGPFVTGSDASFPSALLQTKNLIVIPFFFGCYFGGFFGVGAWAGGSVLMTGGEVAGASPFILDGSVLDGDILIDTDLDFKGTITLGNVFLGATPTIGNADQRMIISPRSLGTSHLRGPAGLNVTAGLRVQISGGTTAVLDLQLTGALEIDSVATAFAFNTATGVYTTPATAITPAAIDAAGSLSNPKTGSKIYVQ
jgi:hypothetical protein